MRGDLALGAKLDVQRVARLRVLEHERPRVLTRVRAARAQECHRGGTVFEAVRGHECVDPGLRQGWWVAGCARDRGTRATWRARLRRQVQPLASQAERPREGATRALRRPIAKAAHLAQALHHANLIIQQRMQPATLDSALGIQVRAWVGGCGWGALVLGLGPVLADFRVASVRAEGVWGVVVSCAKGRPSIHAFCVPSDVEPLRFRLWGGDLGAVFLGDRGAKIYDW